MVYSSMIIQKFVLTRVYRDNILQVSPVHKEGQVEGQTGMGRTRRTNHRRRNGSRLYLRALEKRRSGGPTPRLSCLLYSPLLAVASSCSRMSASRTTSYSKKNSSRTKNGLNRRVPGRRRMKTN